MIAKFISNKFNRTKPIMVLFCYATIKNRAGDCSPARWMYIFFRFSLYRHYGTRENQMNFFLLTTRTIAVTEARAIRTTTLIMEISAVPGTPVP